MSGSSAAGSIIMAGVGTRGLRSQVDNAGALRNSSVKDSGAAVLTVAKCAGAGLARPFARRVHIHESHRSGGRLLFSSEAGLQRRLRGRETAHIDVAGVAQGAALVTRSGRMITQLLWETCRTISLRDAAAHPVVELPQPPLGISLFTSRHGVGARRQTNRTTIDAGTLSRTE